MKINKTASHIALLICLSTICSAEPPLISKWQALQQGFPWVIVSVSQDHGKPAGIITFFALRRDSEGGPATGIIGKQELALKSAQMNNSVLRFEVIRPSDHQALNFQMSLKTNGVAILKFTSGNAYPGTVKLIRQK